MVMRLKLPAVNSVELVDLVINERQAGINAVYFNNIQADWKTRVEAYADAKGNPEIVKPWPEVKDHKKKFHNLYLAPKDGSVQKPILEGLRSKTMQLCPSCGEDGTPNTLDHYLPKEKYPEYSITPINLFPMCDACQTVKGTKTVNGANERLFLHPYFDDFMDMQVLELEIGRPFAAPKTMLLRPHHNLSGPQSTVVLHHLRELAIDTRYHRFFKDEYLRLLRLTDALRQSGQNVRQNLELFKFNASLKSINSWSSVFYSGVLADADLMVYLETAQLPALL